MKIKSENGMVTFKMRAGKHKVISKMPYSEAYRIATTGDIVETPTEIIVNDTYFFPVEPEKKSRKKKEDEVSKDE